MKIPKWQHELARYYKQGKSVSYFLNNAAKICLYGMKILENIEIGHFFQCRTFFFISVAIFTQVALALLQVGLQKIFGLLPFDRPCFISLVLWNVFPSLSLLIIFGLAGRYIFKNNPKHDIFFKLGFTPCKTEQAQWINQSIKTIYFGSQIYKCFMDINRYTYIFGNIRGCY